MQSLPSNQRNLPVLPDCAIDQVVERLEQALQRGFERLRLRPPSFRYYDSTFDDFDDELDSTSTEEDTTDSGEEESSDEGEKTKMRHKEEVKEETEETSDSKSPISELPVELIVRILTFVGASCGPPGLKAVALTCKGFREIVEDPSMDKYIWKACVPSMISPTGADISLSTFAGTRVFPSKVDRPEGPEWRCLWRTLAQYNYSIHEPFSIKLHHPMTTNMATSYTSPDGPFPRPLDECKRLKLVKDDLRIASLTRNEKTAHSSLPEIARDKRGRKVKRVFDFVHSATEASRTEDGFAYVGVKTCGWSDSVPAEWKEKELNGYPGSEEERETATNWLLFTDDPRAFPDIRDKRIATIQRAALIGEFTGGDSGNDSRAPMTLENEEEKPRKLFEGKEHGRMQQHIKERLSNSLLKVGVPSLDSDVLKHRPGKPFFRPVDDDHALHARKYDPTRLESLSASIYNAVGPDSKDPISQPIEEFTTDKHDWTLNNVLDLGLVSFGKSMAHSDANLRLVPRLVKKQLEVDAVQRLALPLNGKVGVNMEWKMPEATKELSLAFRTQEETEEEDGWDEEFLDTLVVWEFRSCGDKLIVCDDRSGKRESTVSCFVGRIPGSSSEEDDKNSKSKGKQKEAPPSEPSWQRRMYIRGATPSDDYFLDNDGLAMNSTVVAYATRRHVFPANPRGTQSKERFRAVMEFHILSLETGETIKILNLSQEERFVRPRFYMWCSFALGDNALFASIGGQGAATERPGEEIGWSVPTRRYGYGNVFVWDLGKEGDLRKTGFGEDDGSDEMEIEYVKPSSKIPLPSSWAEVDKYLTLSRDGRWLGVSAEWGMAVWDLVKKKFEGVWKVGDADSMEMDRVYRNRDDAENMPWNGVWVKYRDVVVPSRSSPPAASGSSSYEKNMDFLNQNGEEEVIREGICFLPNRNLRRLVNGIVEKSLFLSDRSQSVPEYADIPEPFYFLFDDEEELDQVDYEDDDDTDEAGYMIEEYGDDNGEWEDEDGEVIEYLV
ncbi:hypothetical protein RUND412_001118 [Rhizina undulata]